MWRGVRGRSSDRLFAASRLVDCVTVSNRWDYFDRWAHLQESIPSHDASAPSARRSTIPATLMRAAFIENGVPTRMRHVIPLFDRSDTRRICLLYTSPSPRDS